LGARLGRRGTLTGPDHQLGGRRAWREEARMEFNIGRKQQNKEREGENERDKLAERRRGKNLDGPGDRTLGKCQMIWMTDWRSRANVEYVKIMFSLILNQSRSLILSVFFCQT
jgi:hypothetical protein